jgi:hypothetical protein
VAQRRDHQAARAEELHLPVSESATQKKKKINMIQ